VGSRTIPAALALILALFLAWTAPAFAAPPDTEHLPDLQTITPADLKLVLTNDGAVRRLRLTNSIWNAGPGPLVVRPVNQGEVTTAYQRIFSHDAAGARYMVRQAEVGEFAFHPQHGHWHFGQFARYELHDVALDGSVGPNVLAAATKVSFCIVNIFQQDGSLEHAGWGPWGNCDENGIQGLKVGWGDTYDRSLRGQAIDVSSVPVGFYWLVSTVDPEDLLEETDDANNTAAVKIRIRRTSVVLAPS
jgi:hypothetical protein